jgi:hypothetical protein
MGRISNGYLNMARGWHRGGWAFAIVVMNCFEQEKFVQVMLENRSNEKSWTLLFEINL